MADRSWDVALQREQARQQRQREGGRATDLSDRLMDPTAGAPPPALPIKWMDGPWVVVCWTWIRRL